MIFVFDLDGTICFDGVRIPAVIKTALLRLQQKHQLIFASARPIRDLLPRLDDRLNTAILIGGNGSITRAEQQITARNYLSPADFSQLKQWIEQLDLDYLADDIWHYSKRIRRPHDIEHKIDAARLAENRPLSAIRQPIKLILLNLTEPHYRFLRENLPRLNINLIEHSNSNGLYNIDITAKHINKYTTLNKLIGSQPYIAFGNDMNDIELLNHAKHAICVGNFAPLQAVADSVLAAIPETIAEKISLLTDKTALAK
ncbi:HAD-IIB family hydrolase [Pasteurellaceae bacterium LIM206]|nr:HAD-IIB family hydrolase [Pasteurellaceae bacterium LIM206]